MQKGNWGCGTEQSSTEHIITEGERRLSQHRPTLLVLDGCRHVRPEDSHFCVKTRRIGISCSNQNICSC